MRMLVSMGLLMIGVTVGIVGTLFICMKPPYCMVNSHGVHIPYNPPDE